MAILGPRVTRRIPEEDEGLLEAAGGALLPMVGQGLGALVGTLGGPPGVMLGASLGGALGGAGAAGLQRSADDGPGANARMISRFGQAGQGALGAGVKYGASQMPTGSAPGAPAPSPAPQMMPPAVDMPRPGFAPVPGGYQGPGRDPYDLLLEELARQQIGGRVVV
jgi:hypothetical protein